MIMFPNQLALNPEYEKAKAKLQAKREEYASLLGDYAELTGPYRQHLETQYMMKVGRKEYKLFGLQVEMLRIKREISLYQAAKNRGEVITKEQVKSVIEKEFADYKEQLKAQQEKLKLAEAIYNSPLLSPEEVNEVKKVYHRLVMKLHPDLNPNQPEAAKHLWEQVMAAYKDHNWAELLLLNDMAEELLAGDAQDAISFGAMETIQREIEKISLKIQDLQQKMEELKTRPPYCYEELLATPAKVLKKREELDKMIEQSEEALASLKEMLANIETQ